MEFNDRLHLFNRKVELLTSRSFFAHMVSQRTSVMVRWNKDDGWASSFVGPNDESIEASVLTIRQFMQDNDKISIRNVANAYDASDAPQEVTAEFQKVRGWLNEYLSRESSLAISESRRLTNWEVLEMFIYGGLAHSTDPHFSRYQSFMKGPLASVVKVLFIDALSKFMAGLSMLATVNKRILDQRA